ncbi:unnamed protein product [Somion occarium]|uniref:F-box domain-containing protein n=1 Tax=Somion occarium TaxID=3059160 RepID=A0ABP1DFS3_9APHY
MMNSGKLYASSSRDTSCIARLPNELLEKVFICLREELLYGEPTYGCRTSHSWASVCHVCRHWNQVATQCSAFWSHIISVPWHDSSATYMEEMLRRSKQHPLSIHVSSQSRATCLELLETYDACQRLAVATFSLNYNIPVNARYQELVKRHASLDAPALQELTLTYDWPRLGALGPHQPKRRIPFSLGNLPRIWRLNVSRAPLSEIQFFFRSTITHLSMTHLLERIPTERLFDVLNAMPLLEDLMLQNALSSFNERNAQKHCFNYLRRLSLTDSTESIANYLLCFSFPPSSLRFVEIACEPLTCDKWQDRTILAKRLPAIADQFRGGLAEPLRSFSIRHRELPNSQIEISGWSAPTFPTYQAMISPSINLKMLECDGVDPVQLMTTVLDEVSLKDVRTLSFGNLDLPHSLKERRTRRPPFALSLKEHGEVFCRFSSVENLVVDLDIGKHLRDPLMIKYPLDWDEIRLKLPGKYENEELETTLNARNDGLDRIKSSEGRCFLFPSLKTLTIQWQQNNPRLRDETIDGLRKRFMEVCMVRDHEFELRLDPLPGTVRDFDFW